MRPRIFVTQPVAETALARLRKHADVTVNPDASRIIAMILPQREAHCRLHAHLSRLRSP